jgi:A/G-specific adenine glycosylase
VAEIMLQQTRVETVAAYYERFLRRFPTFERLARANHETVLKHWEGLGYYRRVLHLHEAARQVHASLRGIPTTVDGLRRLPGVGAYTAAAIASIAFGQAVAAVDGNVARVIARLFGVADDILGTAGRERIKKLAAELVPRKRPGDFNQAWMDLGSLVCTPRLPDCDRCPLAFLCEAVRTDRTQTLPLRGTGKEKPVELSLVVGVFVDGRSLFVRRRPRGGLWSGLWEFPTGELTDKKAGRATLRRLARQHGLMIRGRPRSVPVVKHRLTHRALTFVPFVAGVDAVDGSVYAQPTRWVTGRGLRRLSVSTAHRRIVASAGAILEGVLDAGMVPVSDAG